MVIACHVDLDGEELLLIVPFIKGLALVQPFIALEPHQLPVQGGRHDLGDLGLADACRAFDQQGAAQDQGHIEDRGQGIIIYIAGFVHFLFQFFQFHKRTSFFLSVSIAQSPARSKRASLFIVQYTTYPLRKL